MVLAPASVSLDEMLSGRLSIHVVKDLDQVFSFSKEDSGQL